MEIRFVDGPEQNAEARRVLYRPDAIERGTKCIDVALRE
jgi:hypothetical protein